MGKATPDSSSTAKRPERKESGEWAKHLRRYLDEFTFRLNEGNVKRHSLERLDSMIEAVSGKRLTYAGLTA
jgi:hypothetical protein